VRKQEFLPSEQEPVLESLTGLFTINLQQFHTSKKKMVSKLQLKLHHTYKGVTAISLFPAPVADLFGDQFFHCICDSFLPST
jgi:hypothetical protein